MESDAGSTQVRRNRGISLFGYRLVITVGKHRRDAEFTGERRDFAVRPAVANDQPATLGAQRGIQFEQ